MRKRCLLGILALSTAAASGQTLEGAKVTHLQGRVQVRQSSVWRLLKEGEQLAESTLLKLAQGSHLSLRYRSDGHREEAEGPGEMVVGKEGLTGNGKLERFGFKNRPLEIPRSGGLDAVGGSVANAKNYTVKPAAPIAPLPGAVAPAGEPRDLAMRLRNDPPPPPPPPLELAWDSSMPRLVGPNEGGLVVGEPTRQAVLFEGDTEIARLQVPKSQSFELSDYASSPDCLYRVELSDGDTFLGSLTFRSLDPDEAMELLELKSAGDVSVEQRLDRMDRFSALGQYQMAAEEGGLWLRQSDPKGDKEQRAAVLQLVYDLNRDFLHDARQTRYWTEWATQKGVELIP